MDSSTFGGRKGLIHNLGEIYLVPGFVCVCVWVRVM